MKYYSTSDKDHKVSLEEAVLRGLSPDGGLYMPAEIRCLPGTFFEAIRNQSFPEIAYAVAAHMIGKDVPVDELMKIVAHTVQFDTPLVEVEEKTYALELFHGPTLAFKDFGARFLSGLLGYFARRQKKEITILVATSGDTGSAVANGFYNVEGTRVVVLYPSGKVSPLQEKQFTTLGGNITALEVDGTFDDCQRLVKNAFLDADLQTRLTLASANSINIARLIPQTFYYFNAWVKAQSNDLVFSVPSGNFGNLTAGLMARRMGLPVTHFIASTNINDIVPAYLRSGVYAPRRSAETISNAMDVGTPSNFARMMDLYQSDLNAIKKDVTGYSFTDNETREAIRLLQEKHYTADPHGAIAFLGVCEYKKMNPGKDFIFLETAHPAKFKEVVEETTGLPLDIPPALKIFLNSEKKSTRLTSDFESFKALLMNF